MNGPQNVMTLPLVDLRSMADSYAEDLQRVTRRVIVCAGTGCVANGSLEVHDALAQRIADAGLPVVTQLEAADPVTFHQLGILARHNVLPLLVEKLRAQGKLVTVTQC
jgi:hypothetical protein